MARLTCDVENYINYFLVYFRDVDTGTYSFYWMYNNQYMNSAILGDIRATLANNLIITFNGNKYDMPLIQMFLSGANNYELYLAGKDIIENNLTPWAFERKYRLSLPTYDHVDLIEVAFGVASLKIYGARLGSKKLQELPIHHDTFLMPSECESILHYCGNDNVVTADLFFELERAIELRAEMSGEYGVDLRSKSDAQIAEHVIKSQYKKVTGRTLKAPKALSSYKYHTPSFVGFTGELLQGLQRTCETVDFKISDKGAVMMPAELNKQIVVGTKAYKMGIGGLHSVDKGGSYYSDGVYQLIDIDVTSYYPYIILNACFEPSHIGELFTTIFRDIVERRVGAKPKAAALWEQLEAFKKAGEQPPEEIMREFLKQQGIVESLKIVINGLFGKFGSRFSAVYSPDLMFHTTVTGQLCLFMLIEQFNLANIQVVSANTDGITVRVHKDMREHLDNVVKWWEQKTNFNMEYAFYNSIHFRDVNNYIAVTDKGKVKGKGIFAGDGIRKNPANMIVRDACMAYVKDGTMPFHTVHNATDITKFLEVRKVAGGAVKVHTFEDETPEHSTKEELIKLAGVYEERAGAKGWFKIGSTAKNGKSLNVAYNESKASFIQPAEYDYLGSSIRWYVSDATDTAINYAKGFNQVAGSERAMPMMDLPEDGEFPSDLDLNWYVEKSMSVLREIKAMSEEAEEEAA